MNNDFKQVASWHYITCHARISEQIRVVFDDVDNLIINNF